MAEPRHFHGDVVINLKAPWWLVIPGILLSGAIGVIGLHASVTGALTYDTTSSRIIAFIIGGFFLLLFVAGAVIPAVTRGPNWLVIGADGIRHEPTGGHGFRVAWKELSGVGVSCTAGSGRNGHRGTVVRLLMVPAEAEFEARHPEMARFRRDDRCYQVPIGPRPSSRELLRAALQRHAGGLDHGVIDEPHRSSYV